MPSAIADSYDALAEHYHLIFENWEIAIQRQAIAISTVLESRCSLPRSARILDCTCGIGTQSLGLAQMGFRVHGSDISRGAVERARLEASQRRLDVHFSVADIRDLSSLGESGFDAVICMDNSLPHLESADQIIQAAAQIRKHLKHGGFFIASIRDYDRLIEERPIVQGPFFYSGQEERRIVFQLWDWIDDRRYIFHLYITRQVEKTWKTFHTSALYRAFQRNELIAALRQAGFSRAFWLEPNDTGFYQPIVLAEAS